jgi:hypothetical protein
LQTTFVLRVFEIWGGDISARSLKVQKIEENGFFHGFLRQNNTKRQNTLAICFVFLFTTHIRTKKCQVVEYDIIQMLTQNLVEVGSVCGPGEYEYEGNIGFTPKLLKSFIAQNIFFAAVFFYTPTA